MNDYKKGPEGNPGLSCYLVVFLDFSEKCDIVFVTAKPKASCRPTTNHLSPMTTETTIKIADDLSTLRVSGAQNALIFDPEDRDIYMFSNIGSGCPEAVWHSRQVSLSVPSASVESQLLKVIKSCEADLVALADLYEGSTWDGSNHVGRWSEPTYMDELIQRIEGRLADSPQYWDAGDWLWGGCTQEEVVRQIREGFNNDVGAWAEDAVAEGQLNDAWIDVDELVVEAERAIEELTGEDD